MTVWRLRDHAAVAIEQVRAYENEPVGLFRKRPFTRLAVIDESVVLPGLHPG